MNKRERERAKRRSGKAERAAPLVRHIASIQATAVEVARATGAAVESAQQTGTKSSEVDGAYDRLQVAVLALGSYVDELSGRLTPLVRQVILPDGPKVDRPAMQSQLGTKIAQEADGVESACHKIGKLLTTLAV